MTMRTLAVLSLVLVSACPQLEDLGGGPDDSGEVSEAEAALAATAIANAALQITSFGMSKPGAVPAVAPAAPRSSLTVTHVDSCSPLALPAVSSSTPYRVTLDQHEAPGSQGSATFLVEFTEDTVEALAIFDVFEYAPMTMDFTFDGTLGYAGEITSLTDSGATLTLDVSSRDFALLYVDPDDGDPRSCDVVVNLGNWASMWFGPSSVSYQRTLEGCVSLCGLAFEISGSESGSVPIE
jgi:hypothetical protein